MPAKRKSRAKPKPPPARGDLYRQCAEASPEAIQYLIDVVMDTQPADKDRIASAKAILSYALPTLRAVEVSGELKHKVEVVEVTF